MGARRSDVDKVLDAIHFAADKHRLQRRKDPEASPYINHPIQVAEVLARVGGVRDVKVLQAAVLHDTIEDTKTTPEELEQRFGRRVRRLVELVTDDKRLPRAERKRLQIEHAAQLPRKAKLIKLADKICNLRDITETPPKGWSRLRRKEYLEWSRMVVAGCRGANPELEALFDSWFRAGRRRLALEERRPYASAPAARSKSGTTRRKRSRSGR
jgi:guanosine-3',5'-bis(diphosphate) 3'-pyrophosphohydrolase